MRDYLYYKERLGGLTFPYAVLDLDLLRKNIDINLKRAANKQIRVASKSLRCVEVMNIILAHHSQFQGIMTYHGKEALHLAQQGFDDLLMGYPIVDRQLLEAIGQLMLKGKHIYFMVDAKEHVDLINDAGKKLRTPLPICIDIDLSDDYPGLRFGVWRSSISNIKDLELLLTHIKRLDYVRLEGIMGYEAQIAGVGDQVSGAGIKNNIVRSLKKRSISKLKEKRRLAVELIRANGFHLKFVNGGGTGSVESTITEEVVSEVTIGSGFYCSHLFDDYTNFDLHPALFYAVQIVRKPTDNIFTCHGGGFIASGAVEHTKAPEIHLPKFGQLDKLEGAGEVQTPIRFKQLTVDLDIGDPIFLRHAKAGELCERFDQLYLLEGGKLQTATTYRGDGLNFG